MDRRPAGAVLARRRTLGFDDRCEWREGFGLKGWSPDEFGRAPLSVFASRNCSSCRCPSKGTRCLAAAGAARVGKGDKGKGAGDNDEPRRAGHPLSWVRNPRSDAAPNPKFPNSRSAPRLTLRFMSPSAGCARRKPAGAVMNAVSASSCAREAIVGRLSCRLTVQGLWREVFGRYASVTSGRYSSVPDFPEQCFKLIHLRIHR